MLKLMHQEAHRHLQAESNPMADTIITLTDGTTIDVPTEHAARIAGLYEGQYGAILVSNDGASDYFYGLTSCCYATGKGADVETGVVCRGCYAEVDSDYGIDLDEQRIIKRA